MAKAGLVIKSMECLRADLGPDHVLSDYYERYALVLSVLHPEDEAPPEDDIHGVMQNIGSLSEEDLHDWVEERKRYYTHGDGRFRYRMWSMMHGR